MASLSETLSVIPRKQGRWTVAGLPEGADALAIVTEWNEFRTPDFSKITASLKNKAIFDGRNLFDLQAMQDLWFHYGSVGRRVVN